MSEQTAAWILYGIMLVFSLASMRYLRERFRENKYVEIQTRRSIGERTIGNLVRLLGVLAFLIIPTLLGISEVNYLLHILLVIPSCAFLLTDSKYSFGKGGVYARRSEHGEGMQIRTARHISFSKTWDWEVNERGNKIQCRFKREFDSSLFPNSDTKESLAFNKNQKEEIYSYLRSHGIQWKRK